MSEEHDLNESVKRLGRLVPIIKDAQGNIIDGFHRQQLDPAWADEFSIKLDNIKDPIQLLLARMNINTCRRIVSAEEKSKWLKELKELTGWSPKEIAENTGMSERWVYQYLPKEVKEPEPEQLVSARVALEKTPEIQKEAQIEVQRKGICSYTNCGMGTNYGKIWEGQFVCPNCYDKLEHGAITLTQYKPDKKPVQPLPVSTTILKPKDTWEQRKATMQVPVSKMETAVLSKLEINNVHPEVQREFCLRTTRPDYYFSQQNLAIYLDGEVHKGREDRDEAIRELLAKRYNVRVVTIAYEGSSEATEDSIVQQIIEALRL